MRRWLGARPLEDDVQRILTWLREEAGGLTHNILSATHSDSIAGAVTRGDLIVGESTPRWARLALDVDTYILRSDGTDAVWADPAAWVPIAPVAQNDMIIADATPAWSILTGPAAQYERLESGAGAFVPAWTVNLGMADDAYIGIPAGGRLVFDSTPAPDQVQITDADLYFATAAHGIIHADGVAAGYVLRADGTRYVPADPTTTVPLAPVAQNDMIIADATPAWSILTGPAAQYERLESGAGAFVPAWTVNLGMADDAYIGIPAGGRLVFDSTPAPDQVQITDADLYFATAAHGIIHVDGVVAGYVLRADGTRYVPADPTTALPLAPVAQGDLIIADGTPAWSILTLGAAAGYALISTATTAEWDQTPVWTGLHTFNAGWLLAGGTADLDGIADALVLDADGDTSISAPTDDQIDVEIAGADDFTITANAFNVLAGSAIVMADGTTIGQAAGPLLTFDDSNNYLELTGGWLGILTTAPVAPLEVEDGGTALTSVVKITQDDTNVAGLTIGNDTSSTTDTHGLVMWVGNAGNCYIGASAATAKYLVLQNAGGNVVIASGIAPTAKLDVRQQSATGAIPVLTLGQSDVSEQFISFLGTAAAGVITQSIVDEGDQASETREGWLKVYVVDAGNQIADQAYFIPIYSLSA